jgi:phospholipase C
MDSRREFLKKAALLSGATGLLGVLPPSIQKAFAINPEPGTTWLDAEHIVILMQENRSFDHTFGSLQGVRGFNDPRSIDLPNGNPVWLQTNSDGESYVPFRLDIKNTKITWMGSLPHSWNNQVDARNNGRCDKWLDVKKSGDEEYSAMPLTMGYYTREDLPFYYALADAFTVCDQNFCSSLTGTTPNRLFLWTGTIREEQNENSRAHVYNEEVDYDKWAKWKTYPERLEDAGVSWKIYQNDLSVDGGLTDEEDTWLDNFTDNPIEFFANFNVKLSQRYINYLQKASASLPAEVDELEKKVLSSTTKGRELEDLKKQLADKKETLNRVMADKEIYTAEKYEQLSAYQKSLHEKAFTSNKNDPDYHTLTTLKYKEGGSEREVNVPKGDVLHQFRADVKAGQLPTISWLVAPEAFSDHPSSAWYGAWYVSETLDILTQNPDVWKKTIFILNYDENDGYFDHVPPFVAPNMHDATTGKASDGLDTSVEFVTMEQEKNTPGMQEEKMRESPIGLGYRVPMVVASPWSRGGWVNSQVFDHTSCLRLIEEFLHHKTGKAVKEPNISDWRRAVSGDIASVFRPYNGEKAVLPAFLERDVFVEGIHKAKFKNIPVDYTLLSREDIKHIKNSSWFLSSLTHLPRQEKGIRQACALPYELYVDGALTADKKGFEITFQAKKDIHGDKAAGAPFNVYAPGMFKKKGLDETAHTWAYAVAAGGSVTGAWALEDFENSLYRLRVYGPNGFYREFNGGNYDPLINITTKYAAGATKLVLTLQNLDAEKYTVEVVDSNYKTGHQIQELDIAGTAKSTGAITLDLAASFGWYDFTLTVRGKSIFERRYAGRIETGMPSFTDPLMGRV